MVKSLVVSLKRQDWTGCEGFGLTLDLGSTLTQSGFTSGCFAHVCEMLFPNKATSTSSRVRRWMDLFLSPISIFYCDKIHRI